MVSDIHAIKILGRARAPEVLKHLIDSLPLIKEKEKLTVLEMAIITFGNKAVRKFRKKIIEEQKVFNDKEKELKKSIPRLIEAYLKKYEEEFKGQRKIEQESVIKKISENLQQSDLFDEREAKELLNSLSLNRYSPNALEGLKQTLEIRFSINEIVALNNFLANLKQAQLKIYDDYRPLFIELMQKNDHDHEAIKELLFNKEDYSILENSLKNMGFIKSELDNPQKPDFNPQFNIPTIPIDASKNISVSSSQRLQSLPSEKVEDEAFVSAFKDLIETRSKKRIFGNSQVKASVRRILNSISTKEAKDLLDDLSKFHNNY